MKRIVLIILVLTILFTDNYSWAQAVHFSQFYASPLVLAPSYAGSSESGRVVANYRDQWPEVKGSFVTYAISYDQNLPRLKSGLGVVVLRDKAGQGSLGYTSIGFSYSWYTQIVKGWYFRPGIEFRYAQRSVDFPALHFADQYDEAGNLTGTVTETPPFPNKQFLDAAASFLIYSDQYWIGSNFDHLFRPDQSLYNITTSDNSSKLPLTISVFGGAKFYVGGVRSRFRNKADAEAVTATFRYIYYDGFDQLDLGTYWHKTPFTLGMWIRGLPIVIRPDGHGNFSSLIFLVGYNIFDFSIGYSFDFTISKLMGMTGGAHEISVTYVFDTKLRQKKKHAVISCPKF